MGPMARDFSVFPVHVFNMPTAIQSQPLISSPHFTSPTSTLIFWVLPQLWGLQGLWPRATF